MSPHQWIENDTCSLPKSKKKEPCKLLIYSSHTFVIMPQRKRFYQILEYVSHM